MSPLLSPLREVYGVGGSFACNTAGRLLVSDVPEVSDLELEMAARQVLNLMSSTGEAIDVCERLTCRFTERNLEVLALEFGALCVLVEPDHDHTLLQVSMRMVARRFLKNRSFAAATPNH